MTSFDLFLSLGIAFALGCDAFAVGLAVGTRRPDQRACFRLWFHFGLFQFLMPIIGWFAGVSIYDHIKGFAPWLAFTLLFVIASRMLYECRQQQKEENALSVDPTRGWSLVGLSLATSIDALGVGFSMGIARIELLRPALIIGLVAAAMTFCGLCLGRRLSQTYGRKVEVAGALILYLIAFKLLCM